ncbi:hypothetical protein ACFWRX_18960 [Streptomyces albidoflavus]
MYNLDQLSNAAADLTGETLTGARERLVGLGRFDELVSTASSSQALLESLIAHALGAVDGQSRPLGVREAKTDGDTLTLRLERVADIEALLSSLPYSSRKGPWRGTRGLTAQVDGRRLRFGLRPWAAGDTSWRGKSPAVWVVGPHGEDLAEMLAAHERRLTGCGHLPQWDPQTPEPGPKRREPATRSLVRLLTPASSIGSALLRRPRLWDSLAGHVGLGIQAQIAEYGVDWIVHRSVTGEHFSEDRLIEILTDSVAGPGLCLLDHTCGTDKCTVRLTPMSTGLGARGVLTVHSRRSAAPESQAADPRPLTAIGERRPPSRPRSGPVKPPCDDHRPAGSVVQLTSKADSWVSYEDLAWIAEQMAAVWAGQGMAAAVILSKTAYRPFFMGRREPTWASAHVPSTDPGWRRLRLAPRPGELWNLEVGRGDEHLAEALKEARDRFDRTVLIRERENWLGGEFVDRQFTYDRILVHPAVPYERHLPLPAATPDGQEVLELTPDQSAIQWRQQELGLHPPRRLTGLLLLQSADQPITPDLDSFDAAVEEQLARQGTPVLGRYPRNRSIVHGLGHSEQAPTVLDPPVERPTHAQMVAAVDAVAHRLWPEAGCQRS